MNVNDKIYILENLYDRLGLSMDQVWHDCKQIMAAQNRINRVRYLDENNKECWLPLDNGGDYTELAAIHNPLFIYTVSDLDYQQTEIEKDYLKKFANKTTFCHIESSNFEHKFKSMREISQYLSSILNIESKRIVCIIFEWRTQRVCDWHQDGATAVYKVSNYRNFSKVSINLPLYDDCAIELEQSTGEIIGNYSREQEMFLFDHHYMRHRIVLKNPVRFCLAIRIMDVDFSDVVQKFIDHELIKHIIE